MDSLHKGIVMLCGKRFRVMMYLWWQYLSTGPKERGDLHDLKAIGLRVYHRRCTDLGVVPISLVVRQFGEPDLLLRHHQCGPKGAEALACPLPVSYALNLSMRQPERTKFPSFAWSWSLRFQAKTSNFCKLQNVLHTRGKNFRRLHVNYKWWF